jgi:hypothetical protein
LADVNPIKSSEEAQVGAIIHDQGCPAADRLFQVPRLLEDLTRVAGLIPVLEESDSSCNQFFDEGAHLFHARKAGGIHDCVQSRQADDCSHFY